MQAARALSQPVANTAIAATTGPVAVPQSASPLTIGAGPRIALALAAVGALWAMLAWAVA